MATISPIEWTDATWNPVTGCTKISAGCTHCYAERMAERLRRMGQPRYADGFRLTLQRDLVALPLKEFELLELLMFNAGRVLTRDVLIDRVWGPNYFGDTKTLDVHVKRLRAKVEDDPAAPTRIVTVRGVGYRYERG